MNGSEREGWRLTVYEYTKYLYGPGDTITVHGDSMTFDTIEDMLDKLGELRSLEES